MPPAGPPPGPGQGQAASSITGRRSLQLDQHGVNLVLLGGKSFDTVQQRGPRVDGRCGCGLSIHRRDIGRLGAWLAVPPDEPSCHGGADRADQLRSSGEPAALGEVLRYCLAIAMRRRSSGSMKWS
jgi:hypothetical protein